jgi:hypothetical protein
MLNCIPVKNGFFILIAALVLGLGMQAKATVDLGSEMTNNCQTSVSTIQILDDMLSQSNLPIYFNANCGPGGTGPDGQSYQNAMDIQLSISQQINPMNSVSIGYELTNDCPTTVNTLNMLNNLLSQQGISMYLSSQCGPGGTATNGEYYNNSVTVNLNVNSTIEPQ